MAYRLTVYIIDPETGKIFVEHCFYGRDRADAERNMLAHLAECEYFRAAESGGYTSEEDEHIDLDEWPIAEETGGTTIDMEEEE